MAFLDEQAVEGLLLETFVALGYERQSDRVIGPDGECAERTSHSDGILMERLKAAVARLNPDLPESLRGEAIRKLRACQVVCVWGRVTSQRWGLILSG